MHKPMISVREASERWITEGKAYKDRLSNWLDIVHIEDDLPPYDWPADTRGDMAEYVRGQIILHNQAGKQAELRQLFPPDNDPMMTWEGVGLECVWQVVMLSDDRLVVTVGDRDAKRVYVINNNEFSLQDNMFLFGRSANRKYFAKVFADKIIITEGWDGPVVKTLNAPENYGAAFKEKHPHVKDGLGKLSLSGFGIDQVVVFPAGERIALASTKGIFIIDEKGALFIQPENDDNIPESTDFTFRYEYPHIDVAPDGKYLVAGTRFSRHLLFREIAGEWFTVATVTPRSDYPHLAKFNYEVKDNGVENDGPQVLLCSCNEYPGEGKVLSLPIKNVTPGFFATGFDAQGDAESTLNDVAIARKILSAGVCSLCYVLGASDNEIYFHPAHARDKGATLGHLYVGGKVMDIDILDDGNKLIAATSIGQVIIYDCSTTQFENNKKFRDAENRHEKRPDVMANTNTCYVDVKRYLFWKGEKPMVW